MDSRKVGNLIFSLRKERGMTQLQLAEVLNVSDKAVSKWERAAGLPDISVIAKLCELFGVDIKNFLEGELKENTVSTGNLKKTLFYICPVCGNIISSISDAGISCCGKTLTALEAKKAEDHEKLSIERIENELYISSDHPMTREHYISFIALVSQDTVFIKKLYPEWNAGIRIPHIPYARMYRYCTNHGLYYTDVIIRKK